jgi:hypothetical protein
MVPALIYSLCAVTSLFCAWLLFRCGLFFVFQACNDVFLVVDKLVVPDIDLSVYRYVVALMTVGVLLYGLIMRTEVD